MEWHRGVSLVGDDPSKYAYSQGLPTCTHAKQGRQLSSPLTCACFSKNKEKASFCPQLFLPRLLTPGNPPSLLGSGVRLQG